MTAENELSLSPAVAAEPSAPETGAELAAVAGASGDIPSDQVLAKKPPTSSTDRSRAHRDRKRDAGGELLSFVLGPSATAALAVLRAKGGQGRLKSKSKTVEATLIAQALASVDTAKAARAMAAKGLIDDSTLNAWIAVIDASNSIAQADSASELAPSSGISPSPGG